MLRTRAKKTSRLVRLQASSSSSLFSPLLSAPWFFPNNLISNVYRITSRQSYHQKNAFPIAAFSLNYHSNSRKPHCRYWMPLLPQHTSGFPLKKISKKKKPVCSLLTSCSWLSLQVITFFIMPHPGKMSFSPTTTMGELLVLTTRPVHGASWEVSPHAGGFLNHESLRGSSRTLHL